MARHRIWLGGIGTAVEIIALALAGLGASAAVWLILLLAGGGLLVYAVLVGETDDPTPITKPGTNVNVAETGDVVVASGDDSVTGGDSIATGNDSIAMTQHDVAADGGAGDGDVRGNVFGPNATISIDRSVRPEANSDPLAGRRRLRKSVAKLKAECLDKTTIQREQIIQPHIGAWLRAIAVVNDVSPGYRKGHHTVAVVIDVDASEEESGELLLLDFGEDQQEVVIALDRGDEIELVGQLEVLDQMYARFIDCELLD